MPFFVQEGQNVRIIIFHVSFFNPNNPESRIPNRIMPSLLDMRRRIKSVKNTQQITKAMKMVAAAKLKRAQDRVTAARPYAQKMTQVLGGLSARIGDEF